MIHARPRPYIVRMLLATDCNVRKSVQVHAHSPQNARAEARRLYPGWRPYNPRAI